MSLLRPTRRLKPAVFRSSGFCTSPAPEEHAPIPCRTEFRLPAAAKQTSWYPKHMSVQFTRMEHRLKSMDLIVEVHDSRIALTGRNPEFQSRLYAIRPHILVLNKVDLIDKKKYCEPVEAHYRQLGVKHILWTDCKSGRAKALRELQAMMLDCTEYMIMVTGIPNVGKSSLINSIRTVNLGKEKQATAVGARPGVTVRLQNRVKILDKPAVYILDTPGVLNPFASHASLNLEHMADYLLYWLNKAQDYSYLRALRLSGPPTDDLQQLLLAICESRDLRVQTQVPGQGRVERWNFEAAVEIFLGVFTRGKLADCFLDRDVLTA
ncbi:G domain-containing protein [Aphelenchoides fujianensis]|nr:G domain-containing protein [Aphelenchoides fujianensis]